MVGKIKMKNNYIQHRLDDLKSDREQLLFWLHKVNEEIKELEDEIRLLIQRN